ncbi:diuretic hormone class 2 [Ischnura elegans]|uniref:diuretic hormone class 2 n=1 Tax=Ischnura elegans TaxID=197161 RepID=UPI001ED898C2|nr:diuretic hormone class 2 [Ischnura elegans]
MKGSSLIFLSVTLAILVSNCHSSSSMSSQRLGAGGMRGYVDLDDPDPEYVLELLARIGQSVIRNQEMTDAKRGGTLDLGMGRGFSGAQAAKHLMGLAAANYAGGPGRRRREALLEE